MRVGIGYDIHRLVSTIKTSSIPLGGVSVPAYYSTQAHSDGDVVLHAVVDACLGALALGDIGNWFPDNAVENKGRPSRDFVQTVVKEIHRLGWRVHNVDVTILLEEPKISPHVDAIRKSLAQLLQIEIQSTSIKAKTMESLGPIGERKAIAAHAVVTLKEEKTGAAPTH